MKLNKFAIAVLVGVTLGLSGCVVVPPRAYVGPPAVYAHPAPYGYGDGHRHGHRGDRY
jgi:hypothetical protein